MTNTQEDVELPDESEFLTVVYQDPNEPEFLHLKDNMTSSVAQLIDAENSSDPDEGDGHRKLGYCWGRGCVPDCDHYLCCSRVCYLDYCRLRGYYGFCA